MPSTSTPTWISTLSTASLRTDMTAADVNGVVTDAGLITLLNDLDSTLSNGSTLTSAEFADLNTIAANLNNGLSTSAYLTYVFDALAKGNAGNVTWTGGNATSVALGNLATGSTQTTLSELIGKWFLGTDLPSSTVSLVASHFTVTSAIVSNPLFGSSGPSITDINQGQLDDCYFLAECGEVASQDPSKITSMFTDNGNGTYGVRFYVNGIPQYVTVNSSLADGGTIFNSATNNWASLAEKAFAQLQTGGAVDTGSEAYYNYGNSYSTIGSGGVIANALEAVTGATVFDVYAASTRTNTWTDTTQNASMITTGTLAGISNSSLIDDIVSALAAHDDVVLDSVSGRIDPATGDYTLVTAHAMPIYGYDTATGNLEIENPWGVSTGPSQNWETTFEISLSTLLGYGDSITIDNAADGPPAPPTITGAAGQTTSGQTATNPFASVTIADPNRKGTDTLIITPSAANGTLSGAGLVSSNGSYTLSGNAAVITSELEALVFTPAAAAPNTAVTTTFTLTDTSSLYATPAIDSATSVIDNTPAVAPSISGAKSGQTIIGQTAINPFASATLTDLNAGGADVLTITPSAANGTLSGAGLVASNGSYTLSGTAAVITTELEALVFTPVAKAPNTSATTTFTLSDVSNAYATATVDSNTTVTDNTPAAAPNITGTATGQTIIGQTAINPFASATLTDLNAGGADVLTITPSAANGTLSGAGLVASNGSYTLSGTAAVITNELKALVFTPVAEAPNTSVTTTFTLSDSSSLYASPTVDSKTTVTNNTPAVAPSISGTKNGQMTSARQALSPFAGVTIADANSGATETLTIAQSGSGALSGNGLAASNGAYTLSGTAAVITSELAALVFTPGAESPNSSATTTFTLTDASSAYGAAAVDSNTTVTDIAKTLAPAQPEANNIGSSGSVTGAYNLLDLVNLEASWIDLVNAFGSNTSAMQNWYNVNESNEKRQDTFDGLDYIASYGDLINAYKNVGSEHAIMDAGAAHFVSNGHNEGRATTFNGLDYIASYSDLIKAFGVNGDAGAYHYIEHGTSEGRTTTFDGLDYIASYSDLIKAYGANEQAGASHFISNGYNEGRTTTFDGLDYIASYSDLIKAFGANNDAGAAHFISNGSKEGRTTTFDGLDYIAGNTDLMKAYGANDAAGAAHFIRNGFNEGRSAAPLNVAAYESAHTDLIGKYATNDAFLTSYINTYVSTGKFLT